MVRLNIKNLSRNIHTYLEILNNGLASFCRQGMASLASALLNVQAAVYGDAAVAAITIANKVYLLVRNIVIGIGHSDVVNVFRIDFKGFIAAIVHLAQIMVDGKQTASERYCYNKDDNQGDYQTLLLRFFSAVAHYIISVQSQH